MSQSRMWLTFAGDPDHQRVQRVVLAAPGPEAVREPEEVLLVDRVQHRHRRLLDDLVLQGGDRQGPLPAVRLGYVPSPGRQGPVRSPADPRVQRLDPAIEVRLVGPPGQPVHAGGGVAPEREERLPEQARAEVVEERGEPLPPPVPRRSSHAGPPPGHARPVLSPARAPLVRVPLGPRPSLPRLRRRSPGRVRRLPRYYGGGWLLPSRR